jgi:hypothetical protein
MNTWWVVPVRAEGASLILGTPEKLFEGPFGGRFRASTWDVAPNAQRLVILKQNVESRAPQTQAAFVFDWFQELERLAPPDGPR